MGFYSAFKELNVTLGAFAQPLLQCKSSIT